MEVWRHGVVGTQAGHHHRLHGVLRTLRSLLLVELFSEDSSDLELGALWSQDGSCYSSRSCGSQKPLGQSVWGDAGDASGVSLRGATVQPDSGVLASLCPQHLQGRVSHPPWSVSVSPSPGATPAQAHSTHRPWTNCLSSVSLLPVTCLEPQAPTQFSAADGTAGPTGST